MAILDVRANGFWGEQIDLGIVIGSVPNDIGKQTYES